MTYAGYWQRSVGRPAQRDGHSHAVDHAGERGQSLPAAREIRLGPVRPHRRAASGGVEGSADELLDFTQFDNDGPDGVPNSGDDDGFVDFVAFVYALPCPGDARAGAIWPHRAAMPPFVTKDVSAIAAQRIRSRITSFCPQSTRRPAVRCTLACWRMRPDTPSVCPTCTTTTARRRALARGA